MIFARRTEERTQTLIRNSLIALNRWRGKFRNSLRREPFFSKSQKSYETLRTKSLCFQTPLNTTRSLIPSEKKVKDLEYRLEEFQNEFEEKEAQWENSDKEIRKLEQQAQNRIEQFEIEAQKYKSLYESSVKNIQNFKS